MYVLRQWENPLDPDTNLDLTTSFNKQCQKAEDARDGGAKRFHCRSNHFFVSGDVRYPKSADPPLTLCPNRSLGHHPVHDLTQKLRANTRRNFCVAVRNGLQIVRHIHVLKVNVYAVVLYIQKHRIGSGGVTDKRRPDTCEGGYWVTHDARGEELRFLVSRGEGKRRGTSLMGQAAKDGVGRLVVSDDTRIPVSGCGDGENPKMNEPGPLADEGVAPEVVQQLDGTAPECV